MRPIFLWNWSPRCQIAIRKKTWKMSRIHFWYYRSIIRWKRDSILRQDTSRREGKRRRSTLDSLRHLLTTYRMISRQYTRSSTFSLFLLLSLLFFPLSFFAFSVARKFHPPGRGHSTAITKRCRKLTVIILAVYCTSCVSHVQEETIISDRVHCV